MPIPKPHKGEKEDSFISRCVSAVHKVDPKRKDDQVVAICYSAWKDKKYADVDIEKYGVRGMQWGHRKQELNEVQRRNESWRSRERRENSKQSTRQLINRLGSLEGYSHHQKIKRLIMSEISSRPGGMAQLAASRRRVERAHAKRWAEYRARKR